MQSPLRAPPCATAIALALALAGVAALAAGGCSDRGSTGGLPPAASWKAPAPAPSRVEGGGAARGAHRAGAAAAGAFSHGSGDEAAAGADGIEGGGAAATDGEGDDGEGAAGPGGDDDGAEGGDPSMGGLEAPDPDRAIDQDKFLAGTLRAAPDTRAAVKPGAVVFIAARPIDPATGNVVGSPLAVDRIEVAALPVQFRLDERNVMVKGTRFEGDVLIIARVDGDGEARTRQPGDVEGKARATIPSDTIDLVLDQIVR